MVTAPDQICRLMLFPPALCIWLRDPPSVSSIAFALFFLLYVIAFHTFHVMPSASTLCLVDCHLLFRSQFPEPCISSLWHIYNSFSFIPICVIPLLSVSPTSQPVG